MGCDFLIGAGYPALGVHPRLPETSMSRLAFAALVPVLCSYAHGYEGARNTCDPFLTSAYQASTS